MMKRNSMRKTLSTKTTTIDPRKPISIEFPTSPQQNMGEEIVHYSHLQHPLMHVTSELDSFTCAGCKEPGAGKRFACQRCDFQLHEFCALSPPVLKAHPLHAHHQLVLHSKPKSGGIMWPRCDICGKVAKGFTFRCGACHFQMHPCCAMLSNEMNFSEEGLHPHTLKLLPPSNSSSGVEQPVCGECKRKRSGRVYRCEVCEYHLHAVCAKNMVNGLQAKGIPVNSNRPNALGPTTRLVSQVFIEFIGGLFEGVGDALGQALIQNITRGRGRDTSTRRS